jgi:hypothetical protein
MPSYFSDDCERVPQPEDWLKSSVEDHTRVFKLTYETYPSKQKGGSIFAPSIAYMTENLKVFFLSPFKILILNRIYTKGVPFQDCFHYHQCWEMEQIKVSEGLPTSDADVALHLKMYFQCNITRSVWGVQSILISETKSAIENVANNHIRPNLPRLLRQKMPLTISSPLPKAVHTESAAPNEARGKKKRPLDSRVSGIRNEITTLTSEYQLRLDSIKKKIAQIEAAMVMQNWYISLLVLALACFYCFYFYSLKKL